MSFRFIESGRSSVCFSEFSRSSICRLKVCSGGTLISSCSGENSRGDICQELISSLSMSVSLGSRGGEVPQGQGSPWASPACVSADRVRRLLRL